METRAKIIKSQVLSDDQYVLKKIEFDYLHKSGEWIKQIREVYDRGDGAAILLYNPEKRTVILTRQFRLPAFLNGNPSGMMTEVCAGLLDGDLPEDCIRRETLEETGYRLSSVRKIFELYMSPGVLTELIHFFVAEYFEKMKVNEGGGVDKHEDIDVIELPFEKTLSMIASGEIKDAKTILLIQYAQIHKLL